MSNTTVPETLGQRLQRLRAAAGLTQAQVAESAGVPVTSLRSWEVDRREPGLRPACRLARALGVTAEYLAETVTVEEAGGKTPRPAGPSKRPSPAETPGPAPKGKAGELPPPQKKPARGKRPKPRHG
jgi:transcriptional regulator with XRE-family HTH domain